MDLLSEILRSIRLEGSIIFRSKLTAPWGFDLPAAKEPRFHIVLEGHSWIDSEAMDEPVLLGAGDAVILRDGESHWVADSPSTKRIASQDASAAVAAGKSLFQGPATDCRLLCGLFRFDKDLTHPLIETLPPLILLRSGEGHEDAWVKRMGGLMDEELIKGDPGTEIMVDRLCELFLIQVLRKISASDDHSFAFVQALEDRVIGRALEMIHGHPEKGWNVENMASATGLSRSAFAKRFHHLTGMPPKAYLTMWRMHRVKALLRNPYNLLGQIAAEVGYSSDVALIRAFQRFFGKSPKQMRLEINPSSA